MYLGNKVIDVLKSASSSEIPTALTKDATLILIDRNMDLIAPTHHGNNLLDR
jgi:hypothetical protein